MNLKNVNLKINILKNWILILKIKIKNYSLVWLKIKTLKN